MRKGLVAIVAVVFACTVVGAASATTLDQAYIYWLKTSDNGITGVRASIGNPDSSQRDIPNGDLSITTVWATNGLFNGDENALQQGVFDVNNVIDDQGHGTCQNHTTGYYYFVETDKFGTLSCYYEAAAASAEVHVQKVQEDPFNSVWWGYRDGVQQTEASDSWSYCGGNACGIYAFGEDPTRSGSPALWWSKFSAPGNTPWQFYNGTVWNTIHNFNGPHLDANWTTNLPTGVNAGTFPNDDPTIAWHFIYNP
jgi:hypothetical protein